MGECAATVLFKWLREGRVYYNSKETRWRVRGSLRELRKELEADLIFDFGGKFPLLQNIVRKLRDQEMELQARGGH